MKCWHCKSELIWGADFNYEDFGLEGEGIVTTLACSNQNCGVDEVLVYYKIKDNNEKTTNDKKNKEWMK